MNVQVLVHIGLLIYFESFGVEHVPKEMEKFIALKTKDKHI